MSHIKNNTILSGKKEIIAFTTVEIIVGFMRLKIELVNFILQNERCMNELKFT